jgi:toxin YhaV
MTSPQPNHGWTIKAHPAFLLAQSQYVQDVRQAVSAGSDLKKTKSFKKLEYLIALTTQRIPSDPSRDSYKLGKTLGGQNSLWRRAKFLQQYRLFFRYSSIAKVIVYAWVNNDDTLRAYGSKTDAYLVFRKMLEAGKVPNSWDDLMAEAKKLS